MVDGGGNDKASVRAPAVFISYASQDAAAAQRICEALRGAGIEVWFDQSELRGGDVWDRQIRKQIHDCALFVPVISVHSDARREGYFRREWKLAVDRTADMAEDVAFLLPVVIDSTPDVSARVPDRFREVQWSRLPDGQTSPAFIEQVRRLLSPEGSTATQPAVRAASGAGPAVREPVRASRSSKPVLLAAVALIVLAAVAYFLVNKFWVPQHATPGTAARPGVAPTAFNPPPHSIAVLPFVNMSGDKEQEYFSDGLTEELLNSLARINELQVAARTSAFSFKGKDTDIGTIARKLNVGAVLEGSVRRSAHTVRITAQLINAVTGFHLWSETYDRDLGDVLKLQTEIATAVANALKITLLGNVDGKIELGGTRNPAAFDAYLRASKAVFTTASEKGGQAAIAAYAEAIRLDPHYALAYADRSLALVDLALGWAKGSAVHDYINKARADARKAIELAPDLGEGHAALGRALYYSLEFERASQELQHALALAPGSAKILHLYGSGAVKMGETEAGLAAIHRSVVLDPLNPDTHFSLGESLTAARRDHEAIVAFGDAIAFAPSDEVAKLVNGYLAFAYYSSGNLESARTTCEKADELNKPICLAILYDKIGRHADAERIFADYRASWGDAAAVFYAGIYAQWGDTARALDWLETAMRLRDPWLLEIKTEPLLDPVRKEPRFQAIERALKFPPQ
jgi:TolB-like protein/Flp pilus assembly protein TadD